MDPHFIVDSLVDVQDVLVTAAPERSDLCGVSTSNVNGGNASHFVFDLFFKTSVYSFFQQVIAQSHEKQLNFDFAHIEGHIQFAPQSYFDTTLETNHHEEMSHNNTPSLITLPMELIYRILDCLAPKHILLSVYNVCERLNSLTDVYPPYQVKSRYNFSSGIHEFRRIISHRKQTPVVFHKLDRFASVWGRKVRAMSNLGETLMKPLCCHKCRRGTVLYCIRKGI